MITPKDLAFFGLGLLVSMLFFSAHRTLLRSNNQHSPPTLLHRPPPYDHRRALRNLISRHEPNMTILFLKQKQFEERELERIPNDYCKFGMTFLMNTRKDFPLLTISFTRPSLTQYYYCVCPKSNTNYNGQNCHRKERYSQLEFSVGAYRNKKVSISGELKELVDRYRVVSEQGTMIVPSDAVDDSLDPSWVSALKAHNNIDQFFLDMSFKYAPWLHEDTIMLSRLLDFNQKKFIEGNGTFPTSWLTLNASSDGTTDTTINQNKLLFVFTLKSESGLNSLKELIKSTYSASHYFVINVNKELGMNMWSDIQTFVADKVIGSTTNKNIELVPFDWAVNSRSVLINQLYMEMLAVLHAYQKKFVDWANMIHLSENHVMVKPVVELVTYLNSFDQDHQFHRIHKSMKVEKSITLCYHGSCQTLPAGSKDTSKTEIADSSMYHISSNKFYRTLLSSRTAIELLIEHRRVTLSNSFMPTVLSTLQNMTQVDVVDGKAIPVPQFKNHPDYHDLIWADLNKETPKHMFFSYKPNKS